MSKPGSNGVLDGERHAMLFSQWERDVEDFRPYLNQGALSISKIADECGLNRNVFYTNRVIRYELMPALEMRLEREGLLKARVNAPAAVIIKHSRDANAAGVKLLQEQNEALKAEVASLRAELRKHQILRETGRLPW
jgi:hypothetical protein